MSQQDGFGSGFVIGSIVGGVIGGVLGTLLASRQENKSLTEEQSLIEAGVQPKLTTEENMEIARHSLEDKIAQLNLAIDDVRQQLGSVNGNKKVEE